MAARPVWEPIVSYNPVFQKSEKNEEKRRKREVGIFQKIRFDRLSDPNRKNILLYRGVAQLVGRVPWEHQAVGSNPATPTRKQPVTGLESPVTGIFFIP